MRLPFPERIPLFYAFTFALVLCTVQVLEGTPAVFSLCCFLFIMIAALAFNVAGGFTRPSGSYIFAYAVLCVIVGLFWKAVLGEPADTNLSSPQLTIEVYLGGICSMYAAIYISRKLTTKGPLLGTLLDAARMRNATLGCVVIGLLIITMGFVVPNQNGSFFSALRQVDHFLPMAIIIGVVYQIRKSGGTSSFNFAVLLSFVILFFQGLLGFSKEGMLTPLLCWLVAACCMRYRLSFLQIITCILIGVFTFQYLVPYSQYGRNYRATSFSEDLSNSITLLSQLGHIREEYRAESAADSAEREIHYFNKPQGFFDRLEMLSMDDALINVTSQGHTFGLSPVWASFENLVPHIIWPNKPDLHFGTVYAHEIGGIVSESDTTTGISFSPTGEAFHLAGWGGIFLLAPGLWIVLFTLFDSLCGDTRLSPWGLVMMPYFAHMAPEGGVSGIIYTLGFGTIGLVFTAAAAIYFMPIVGTLIVGPERTQVRRRAPIRSIPASTAKQLSNL